MDVRKSQHQLAEHYKIYCCASQRQKTAEKRHYHLCVLLFAGKNYKSADYISECGWRE